ncbi:MAG: heavy-metal-associated domain-containing protein, partial [Candidatus Paceibacterales bacterium]
VLLSLLLSIKTFGQFTSAEIGVDGLTCSQCQRGVEMSIRKLDFIQDILVNLEHTNGKITFKSGSKVNMDKIAKAVSDAGFSVRFLKVNFTFNNLNVSDNFCFSYQGDNYQFIKAGNQLLNGEKTIKIVGKNFMSAKEYKSVKAELIKTCDKLNPTFFVML